MRISCENWYPGVFGHKESIGAGFDALRSRSSALQIGPGSNPGAGKLFSHASKPSENWYPGVFDHEESIGCSSDELIIIMEVFIDLSLFLDIGFHFYFNSSNNIFLAVGLFTNRSWRFR